MMEYLMSLQQQERMLREENEKLEMKIADTQNKQGNANKAGAAAVRLDDLNNQERPDAVRMETLILLPH